jgi:hypothetical protein
VFQDWRYWLQEGIVDYVLPMDYYREADPQNAWFDAWSGFQVANPGRRGVAIGVGSYLNSAQGALAQVGRARALNPLGVALYSYAVPTRDLEDSTQADREAFAARLRELFPRPAPAPSLAWQQSPASGGLAIEVPGHEGISVVAEGSGTSYVWRTDGTGLAGAVEVTPGRYVVTVFAPDVDSMPFEVRVTPGTTALVRLAPGTPAS